MRRAGPEHVQLSQLVAQELEEVDLWVDHSQATSGGTHETKSDDGGSC